MRNLHFTVFVCILIAISVDAQSNPQSPCPGVFRYQYDDRREDWIGSIEASVPDDNSNVIRLDVQLSVGNPVQGFTGSVELANPKSQVVSDVRSGRSLSYRVYFPRWIKILPRITQISINGNRICFGYPIEKHLVQIVTTINLQHTLTIGTPLSWGGGRGPSGGEGTGGGRRNNWAPPQDFDYDAIVGAATTPQSFNGGRRPTDSRPLHDNQGNGRNPNRPFLPDPTPIPPLPSSPVPTLTPKDFEIENDDLPTLESNLVKEPRNDADVCGVPSVVANALLIHGSGFQNGVHPWLAAIFVQNSEGGLIFICGSSLVSHKHIITAAHCIQKRTRRLKPEELWIVLGRDNIQRWSGDNAKIVQAERTHIHPDHQPHTADGDIAIVVLSEEITFTPLIKPVCLWTGDGDLNLIVGRTGTVIGWGKDESGKVTPEPKQIAFPVVSEEVCLRSNQGFARITSNRTFCAGYKNNSGPCNGDSGGGFLMQKNGKWYLRGIVSMSLVGSDGSCDLEEYVVFTDVPKYLGWILSII